MVFLDQLMYDVLTGTDNLNTTKQFQQQLICFLDKEGVELHNWPGNNPFLLSNDSESEYPFTNGTKTSGISWKLQPTF